MYQERKEKEMKRIEKEKERIEKIKYRLAITGLIIQILNFIKSFF